MKILSYFILLLALCSCKKGPAAQKQLHRQASIQIHQTDMDVSNPLNPYDYAGRLHNDYVSYALSCLPDTGPPDAALTTICIMQYTSLIRGTYRDASFFDSVLLTVSDSTTGYKRVIGDLVTSPHAKKQMGLLIELVRNEIILKRATLPLVIQKIRDYENLILRDDRLTHDEQKRILTAASIARYSTLFWTSLVNEHYPELQPRIMRWIAAITSDIAGGLVSGHVGYAAECSTYAWDLVTYSLP